MRIAALDLGTNTSLLLVCEVEDGRVVKVLADELTVTRLGQEVNATGRLHPEALERAEQCFANYQKIIESYQCDEVVAVATSAARDASNSEDFFNLGKKYSIPIYVIPGAMEAKLTFLGATSHLSSSEGVSVIDVGGGSTEIIAKSPNGSFVGKSLDIGSVRLTEMFDIVHPVDLGKRTELKNFVIETLSSNRSSLPQEPKSVVAVAGTPTTLSCVIQAKGFSEARVEGFALKTLDIDNLKDKMSAMKLDEVKSQAGMDPKRADVIVAGSTILSESAKHLGLSELQVSTRGVRYGVAMCWREIVDGN